MNERISDFKKASKGDSSRRVSGILSSTKDLDSSVVEVAGENLAAVRSGAYVPRPFDDNENPEVVVEVEEEEEDFSSRYR